LATKLGRKESCVSILINVSDYLFNEILEYLPNEGIYKKHDSQIKVIYK